MTIWRMPIACWIPNATNTHSEYAIFFSPPLQQWFHQRASMLLYRNTACIVDIPAITYSVPRSVYIFFQSKTSRPILSITNKMQRYTIFFIAVKALYVSGGFPAHHQELKNCTYSIWYLLSLVAATASYASSSSN